MNHSIRLRTMRCLLAMCFILGSGASYAVVVCDSGGNCVQTIQLTPGWNSIYIQVDPAQDATEQVFADLIDGAGPQLSSVWTWLAHRAKIDFVQDPDPKNLLSDPGWLRYFPAQAGKAFLTNLHAIQANRAYLVKLEGTNSATLTITGKPVVPRAKWEANSFNHLGFHVDPQNLPTFADFFASSLAHKGQPIYQLINDSWQKVDPLTTVISPDTAYWIFSKTGSDYTGPLQVKLPQLDGLEYGEKTTVFSTRVRNLASSPQSVSIQVIGNAAGMYYRNPDAAAEQSWLPLSAALANNVATDGNWRLSLGVRRADFQLGAFDHTLQITSSSGSRWLIPVSALAPQLKSLWVGSVTINGVSQVQNYKHTCVDTAIKKTYETYDADGQKLELSYDDFSPNYCEAGSATCSDTAGTVYNNTERQGFDLCRSVTGFPIPVAEAPGEPLPPVKEGAEFSFRVIFYDDGSQVKLLKDVIQMWEKQSVDANGNTIPGQYVLLTDDTTIANYEGTTLRDGEIVGRRISSIAYDFVGNSHVMTGSLDGQLQTTLVVAADAATNPFRHHYHNDHKGPGYEVTRTMTFDYVPPANANGISGLEVGREVIQGNYREVITGLHKNPIAVSGTYTLRHAMTVDKFIDN